jgi:hypothetical protein
MVAAFPLTIIPLVIYLLFGYTAGGAVWLNELLAIPMVSGLTWTVTAGDLLIILALVMLFFEVLKAARPAIRAIPNHIASTIVFIVYLILFLLAPIAANSTFFILTAIALFDVIAGFTVSIRTAQRDIALGQGIDGN